MTSKILELSCYQAVWLHDQKYQDKHLNILRTKTAFKMNLNHFSSFLKGFLLQKIDLDPGIDL